MYDWIGDKSSYWPTWRLKFAMHRSGRSWQGVTPPETCLALRKNALQRAWRMWNSRKNIWSVSWLYLFKNKNYYGMRCTMQRCSSRIERRPHSAWFKGHPILDFGHRSENKLLSSDEKLNFDLNHMLLGTIWRFTYHTAGYNDKESYVALGDRIIRPDQYSDACICSTRCQLTTTWISCDSVR